MPPRRRRSRRGDRAHLTDYRGTSIVWSIPRKGSHAETGAGPRTARTIGSKPSRRRRIPPSGSLTRSAAGCDLKEEMSHVVPRPPGCRTSTRLGARPHHPEARVPRTTRSDGRPVFHIARPGELGAQRLQQRRGLGECRRGRGEGHQPGGCRGHDPVRGRDLRLPGPRHRQVLSADRRGHDPGGPGARPVRSLPDVRRAPLVADTRRQQHWRHALHHRVGQPQPDDRREQLPQRSRPGSALRLGPHRDRGAAACRPGRDHLRRHPHRPELGRHHHRDRADHQQGRGQLAPDDRALVPDAVRAQLWQLDHRRHRHDHRAATGPLPDDQPGPERHPARGRAPGHRQLHQLRPDHDPGRRIRHQRPVPQPARPGRRVRPDARSRSPPARPRRPPRARSPTWPPRRSSHRAARSGGASRSRSARTFRTSAKAPPGRSRCSSS